MTRNFALALAALMSLAASHAAAAVIYQESFGGAGGPLNGKAVGPTAANWAAGSVFLDNGAVNTVVSSGANGQAAHLPFAPQAGKIYTLKATILNTFPDWIAVGFFPALPAGGDWSATNANLRHTGAGGYAWGLTRNHPTNNDQEFFNGKNTSNIPAGVNGDVVDPQSPVDFQIVLNTTAPTWTAAYFLNGIQRGAVQELPGTANLEIGGVGFSRTNNATANNGGVISNFELSVVPEPASIALGMFGLIGVGVAVRRRI